MSLTILLRVFKGFRLVPQTAVADCSDIGRCGYWLMGISCMSCRSRSQIFYCPVQSLNSMKSKVLLMTYNFLIGHFFIRSSTKMLWQIMKKKYMRSDFIVIAWVDRPVSEWSEFLIFCDRVWIRAQKDCVLTKLPWCILPTDSYAAPVVSG